MISLGRNEPCSCGSGKKFKNCCLGNRSSAPSGQQQDTQNTTAKKISIQVPQLFEQALNLHQKGQLAQARVLYEQLLQIQPNHFDALHFIGVIAYQTMNPGRAIDLIGQAIAVNPQIAETYYNRGNALRDLKQHQAAVESYDKAIALRSGFEDVYNNRGLALRDLKQHPTAIESFDKAIALKPGYAEAYNNRGLALRDIKQNRAAIESFDKAIALKSGYAEAYNNRGNALRDIEQYQAAIESFDKAVALSPAYADAHYNRGNALRDLEQYQSAIESYDKAIALNSGHAAACNNRGNALHDLKQYQAALENFNRAIALKSDYAEAYNNRGVVLRDLKQHQAAIENFDKAIALKSGYAEAYNNRGNALRDIKQNRAAIESFDKAIALQSDYAEAYNNRGFALHDLNQHRAAIESYDKAMALKPGYEFLYGVRMYSKMRICDWLDIESQCKQLEEKIERNEKATYPFPALAITSSLSKQRKVAEIFVQDRYPVSHILPAIQKHPRHDRIRVGYFSADFRSHPVSLLTVGLFEAHDKSKYELTAFSFGPDTGDDIRKRVVAAFDRFIDVRDRSDQDIAMLARNLEIDIAVDLGGFTTDCRTGIFAMRAAPVQVSYIGYLGTMGAEYIDYLIADHTIIPEASRQHYSEKIVYLPSYQANDSKRVISGKQFTREELGLPPTGFVFCCFNNSYKITPGTFDGWMRILKRVEGSVLLLLADNEQAAVNLKKEAVLRGVDAGRLIFGERLPLPEYLARYSVADLFLDTLPYNAGTTASDALWAGLPVLTCTGETFASRVAASLLNAVHLPELVTSTQDEYEALAVALAENPESLGEIKGKLANNRLAAPLFDTRLFTKHIEAAYTAMHKRNLADMPPEHINIGRF